MTMVLTPFLRSEVAGARLIASAWAAYYAALWNGDPAASGFAEWLAGFWEPALERPDGAPAARSVPTTEGFAIDWFEREGWVFGIIPGQSGGYLLPRVAILAHPWLIDMVAAA